MTILLWMLAVAALFAAASVLALWSYGRFARKARGAPAFSLPLRPDETRLDRVVAPLAERHPGESGLAFVTENRAAFAQRLLSARDAGRSLDVLSYIFCDDMTGRLIARGLLAAADRGVRVRLLLDDVNVQGFDPSFRALNGHPGIEVRLFNPIRNRRSALHRGLDMLLNIIRFNRRMHAKLWIVDGRFAITGGRNIGNVYFDAAGGRKRNNRDGDLLFVGALVEDASKLFDSYWNSALALPIAAFWRDYDAGLERFRARLEANYRNPTARAYLARLPKAPAGQVGWLPERLHWTAHVRLMGDPPDKALGQARACWMPEVIVPMMNGARSSLRVMTPYFVPGNEGMAQFIKLAERGVSVDVMTNALAATNHALVHGAYRRYRRPLLAAGVRLFEFAPVPHNRPRPEEMLHGKCFVVDGARAFIGSFNFDLRSAFLNIEAGVVVDHAGLVADVVAEFDRLMAEDQSYRLNLDSGRLHWHIGGRPGVTCLLHEPEAPAFRRGTSWIIGHLPIHSYL